MLLGKVLDLKGRAAARIGRPTESDRMEEP